MIVLFQILKLALMDCSGHKKLAPEDISVKFLMAAAFEASDHNLGLQKVQQQYEATLV